MGRKKTLRCNEMSEKTRYLYEVWHNHGKSDIIASSFYVTDSNLLQFLDGWNVIALFAHWDSVHRGEVVDVNKGETDVAK